ncbi:hypothetical protein LSTR_LSTR003925 [Laodelphax striatellus]|uniref:Peptidase S1 domain-containing protein n=1 Tax=Laodelphax striatellus TaxID=195883 RepID=A0A482X9C3_LAOST|nr:hypothetical protein LSTR_LSTR003925 [Laodelphax striatellus]
MILDACYFTVINIVLLSSFLGDAADSEVIISTSPSKNQMSIPRKACEIPVSSDYYYLSLEGNTLDTKRCYDGSGKFAVRVVCFEDSKMIRPDNFAVCFDGQWYPSKHTCVQKTCAPVYDIYSSLHTCTNRKGVEVNCRLPAEPGTKITIRCAHWRYKFSNNNYNNITVVERFCQKSGKWQPLEVCASVCGLISNNDTSFEENGDSSLKQVNKYFWNAVIFGYRDGGWKQLCFGTVITDFLVLTAYDCIGESIENGTVKVAFGKYFKNYSDYDQDQVYNVLNVGRTPLFPIIMLAVAEYIEHSNEVGIVCLHKPDYIIDVEVGHIVTRGKDGSQSVVTLQCKPSKREIEENTFIFLRCPPTNNHTFGPDELGGGLVVFRESRAILTGVLVQFDGRIPIFVKIGEPQIGYYILRHIKKFEEWRKKNDKYWFIRRGDYN